MKKSGFTLIELSIVLVIIGLIVGGVLVGKDLIEAAKIRKQISQITEIETQINTFKLKYNCLPGDCANATQFFGSADASGNVVLNGNGNGILKSEYGAGNPYAATNCAAGDIQGEVSQLFFQLGLSGLSGFTGTGGGTVTGSAGSVGVSHPSSEYNKRVGVFISCLQNVTGLSTRWAGQFNVLTVGNGIKGVTERIQYAAGMANGASTLSSYAGGIPPMVIYQIDTKLDDGLPDKGRIGPLFNCNSTPINATYTSYPAMNPDCNATMGKIYPSGL